MIRSIALMLMFMLTGMHEIRKHRPWAADPIYCDQLCRCREHQRINPLCPPSMLHWIYWDQPRITDHGD